MASGQEKSISQTSKGVRKGSKVQQKHRVAPKAETQRLVGKRSGRNSRLIHKRVALAPFAFVLFLLLGSLLLVYLVFRDNRSFDGILREIDQSQSQGTRTVTLRLYQSAYKKAETVQDYLRIFKRIYQIQDDETRSNYLVEVTAHGVREFPSSEELWAYRVSVLLDLGLFPEALVGSENLESARYLLLKGEIMVRSLAMTSNQHRIGSEKGATGKSAAVEELSIAQIVNSSPYIAATYVSLARMLNEPRFAWDAILMYMVQGEKAKAKALLGELQDEPWLNNLAAGIIAYDNQDWPLARRMFERRLAREDSARQMEVLQYLGDVYAYQGNYQEVIEVLEKASSLVKLSLQLQKDEFISNKNQGEQSLVGESEVGQDAGVGSPHYGNWELYYNLASAYQEIGENALAFEVLRQGRNIFPHASELLLLLNAVAPADEKEYAKSVLAEFISRDVHNQPSLALAALVFEEKRINQQKFSSNLWDLFSDFPEYEQILHYMLWYYIGLNRIDEVELALDRYKNLVLENPDKPNNPKEYPIWAKEYMAIVALLERDFTKSERLFNDIITKEPSWRVYLNMSNVYIYQSDFSAAMRVLRKGLAYAQNVKEIIYIYHRIVSMSVASGRNFLSGDESLKLDSILRDEIRRHYRIDATEQSLETDLLNIKLDNLILWRKANGSDLLSDPEQYREEVGTEVAKSPNHTFATAGPDSTEDNDHRLDTKEVG